MYHGFIPGVYLTTQTSRRMYHGFIPSVCLTTQNSGRVVQEEKEKTSK